MKASKFYSTLHKSVKNRHDIAIKKYKLQYKKGVFDFLRISSKQILKSDKIILIRAGIHGDEIAGPLAILNFINEIIDYIHGHGFKFIIYPIGNPSGFEKGLRYNIDNDIGNGNNDFLRYELKNGKIIDDIKESNNFKKWHWASDKKLKLKLPKETKLMHQLLKKGPLSQIVACIDLHQDYISSNAPAVAYHYASGNLKIYKNIIKSIENILPIFRNEYIGAGFNVKIDKLGKIKSPISKENEIKSDNDGFIIRHDGTLGDLMDRLGVKHSICVETTGKTPLKTAEQVNLIWIFGIIDILKES